MEPIGLVIPTYQARSHLPRLLPPIRKYYPALPILLIDSSSSDGTPEYARSLGAKVEVIPKTDFNHGLTREFGRNRMNASIVVMMTQDAIPAVPDFITRLVQPIENGVAAIAYARQIPHEGAGFFESFPREYNYPSHSEVRGVECVETTGNYTYFCSNSCAAWSSSALDEIGGFEPVLFGEDTVAAARLLKRGHKIAYVAEAVVSHSHSYTLTQELRRHFDAGFERRRFREVFSAGSDRHRGARLTKEMFSRLSKGRPWALPYGMMIILCKYLGYYLGSHAQWIPPKLWPRLSSQPSFWKTETGQNISKSALDN